MIAARLPYPSPEKGGAAASRYGPSHVLLAGPADAPPVVCLHAMRTGAAHLLSELGRSPPGSGWSPRS